MSYLKNVNTGNVDLAKINVDEDLLDILFEIAMLGISRSCFEQSKAILMDCLALQPQRGRVLIGLGLYCIANKEFDDAIQLFSDLLKQDPKNEYAKVHLGIAQWHAKKFDEAKKTLKEVVDQKGDQSTVALASAVLDEMKAAA